MTTIYEQMADEFRRWQRPWRSDLVQGDELTHAEALAMLTEIVGPKIAEHEEIRRQDSVELNRVYKERDALQADNARLQLELDASCNAEELRQVREENVRLRKSDSLYGEYKLQQQEIERLNEIIGSLRFTIRDDTETIAELRKAFEKPVAWMWQHGETGNIGFLSDAPEEDIAHWERINTPRKVIAPLFTKPAKGGEG